MRFPHAPQKNMPMNKRNPKISEKTILHMGGYDIQAADEVRKKMHEYYLASMNDPMMLNECLEALIQFYIIFKFSVSKGMRKRVDEKIEKVEYDLGPFLTPGEHTGYMKIRREVRELIELIYWAKQKVNLGIPMERVVDDEMMLEEMSKV